ncbi:hypothetical protein V8D89_014786, partial [Ganoderma adspersum]
MITLTPTNLHALLVGLAASAALWLWKYRTPSSLPLPPGPKPLPIIGNLLDMPSKDRARKFWELGRAYGDIVYFDVFGQPTVVINTYDAAASLLDIKSANTSDRPRIVMADLLGLSQRIFALTGYGPGWRRQRRTFHEFFQQGAIPQYRPIFLRQAKRFLQRLLITPEKFIAHSHLVIGASIMEVVYGIELTEGDKFLSIAKKGADIFSNALSPGRYLVELFPVLAHLPSWFPGAKFKRDIARWLPDSNAVPQIPYNTVKRAMVRIGSALLGCFTDGHENRTRIQAQGIAKSCMTTTLLERAASKGRLSPDEDQLFEDVAGLAYGAGTDTSYTYLTTFFLAMTLHLDVRRRGQAELDAVVGPDRLPAFFDRQSLPYVNAIVKECLRWHSVLPLGIPHRAIHEDEYDGWHIPAGTILLANA